MYKLIDIRNFKDNRGTLSVLEDTELVTKSGERLPFCFKRCFWIKDVPQGMTRGAHAHRTCGELIVAAHGKFDVDVTDGCQHETIHLSSDCTTALYIPPYTWCELHSFSVDALCLCLASQEYIVEGYIEDYESYKKIMTQESKKN